jgi:hypothetical protein
MTPAHAAGPQECVDFDAALNDAQRLTMSK